MSLDSRARPITPPARWSIASGPEIAADVVDERLGAHRAAIGRRLDRGEGDVPSEAAAPPLLGRASLGIGTGDLERPSLVTDGDRRPAVADRCRITALAIGADEDLAGHRVVDAAHLDELGPRPPRVGECRVSRVGPRERPVDLVEQLALLLDRGRPPADVEPHQCECPVQERLAIGRVGPPRRDVGGDSRVGDRRVEPVVVARPEHGGDRPIERDSGYSPGCRSGAGSRAPPGRHVPSPASGRASRGRRARSRSDRQTSSRGRPGSLPGPSSPRSHVIDRSTPSRSTRRPMNR